ncbi:hypothetical protein GBF38_023305 [Xyrichtys novacula]|uniref:Uncharacterized protein n=1 Tax=Xyrichtys novacula TaxID=13765 RepID=A0AAV1H100_XYRNO|nr:hypothetical protein GBF38_023305 [Xyrichtys novacula]
MTALPRKPTLVPPSRTNPLTQPLNAASEVPIDRRGLERRYFKKSASELKVLSYSDLKQSGEVDRDVDLRHDGGCSEIPSVSLLTPHEQLLQQHVSKKEGEVLSDQQLCNQEGGSSLDQADPEPLEFKEEQTNSALVKMESSLKQTKRQKTLS